MCTVGQTWEDKVKAVRVKLEEKNAHGVVISALDEVACMYQIYLISTLYALVLLGLLAGLRGG